MPEDDEPTADEWLEIEAADAYLDALGNARDFDGDDLGGTQFRDDIDREPLGPIDEKALAQYRAEQAAEAQTPPAPSATTGGTPVSEIDEAKERINQIANQVMTMAEMAGIQAMVQQFKQSVSETLTTVAGLIGGTQECADVEAAGAQLMQQADGLFEGVQTLNQVIATAADATRRRSQG